MKSNIKNFVEEYNKRMSWNADIIKQLGKKNIPAKIINDYLSTELINGENYDLENASLYEYGPDDAWAGTLELQLFSNKSYRTVYFWVRPIQSENEYKSEKIEIIKKQMNEKIDELYEKIKELTSEFKHYNKLKKMIDNINQ